MKDRIHNQGLMVFKILFAFALLFMAFACEKDSDIDGGIIEKEGYPIGPEGAHYTSEDNGLTVFFPDGAVTKRDTLFIDYATIITGDKMANKNYRLELKSGRTIQKPVTLIMNYDDSMFRGEIYDPLKLVIFRLGNPHGGMCVINECCVDTDCQTVTGCSDFLGTFLLGEISD